MFGKSNDSKKIKALEDEIQFLKANMKMKFQKLDWANDLIQLRGLKEKFDELEKSLNKKNQELEKEIGVLKKMKTLSATDFPEVPWIREIISNPKSEKFQCLPPTQKLHIWKNIFDNIGLASKTNIAEQYPFHLDEEDFEGAGMQMFGLAYLGQLGRDSNVILTFRDFKMLSEEYQYFIEKIILMAKPDATIHDYEVKFLEETREFQITFGLEEEEVDFKIEGNKYMDMSLVTKVIRTVLDDIEPTQFYYWLTCDFGSYLLFVNHYQKSVLEELFKLKRGLEAVDV